MTAPLGRPWLAEVIDTESNEPVKTRWFQTRVQAERWAKYESSIRLYRRAKVSRVIHDDQMSLLGEHPPREDRVIPGQQMIAPAVESLAGSRDGATFAEEDRKRLNKQALRVYAVMRDEQFHSLHTISERTGDPEASISARLRDLRKAKFGGHTVVRRRIPETGVWVYRLVWNDDYPRPPLSEVEDAYA